MNLQNELDELLSLEDRDDLFLSVYLDTSVNSHGQRTFPVFLKKKTSVLAKLQEYDSEQRTRDFHENVTRVQGYLFEELERDTRGVAIFCSVSRGYFKAIQLPVPLRNKFAVSTSPNLDILIELVEESRQHCVVAIDQHSGRIFSVYLYDVVDAQAMQHDNVPGRTKVGGWSQMRYQRHRQDHIMHFMKEFAELLEGHVRRERPNSIVLLGIQSNLAEFRKHLSPETHRLILLSRSIPPHKDEKELVSKVRTYLREAESTKSRETVTLLYDRLCQDYLAVVGLDETLFSLQIGRLERLFVSNQLNSRGFRCTHCDFIFSKPLQTCSYCQGHVEQVELRNRMEKLAEHHDVAIDIVPDNSFLDALGGVGGFLRF